MEQNPRRDQAASQFEQFQKFIKLEQFVTALITDIFISNFLLHFILLIQ